MLLDLIELILDLVFDGIERLIDSFYTSERLGTYGERMIEKMLKKLDRSGKKGTILKNVYLPKEEGGTTEVDLLYITQKGIFVFESKNYSGWIFGNSKDLYWTQSLGKRKKNRFYDPIKQNETHMKCLAHHLWREVPMFSLVVFSERCELKNVTFDPEKARVLKRGELGRVMCELWDAAPDALTEAEISDIVTALTPLTEVDETVKKAHVEAIREEMAKHDPVCPRCGAKLVLRTAKKGANAGEQFYGCSRFPKCRYVQKNRTRD